MNEHELLLAYLAEQAMRYDFSVPRMWYRLNLIRSMSAKVCVNNHPKASFRYWLSYEPQF